MRDRLACRLRLAFVAAKEWIVFGWPIPGSSLYLGLKTLYHFHLRRKDPTRALDRLGMIWRNWNRSPVEKFCRAELSRVYIELGPERVHTLFRRFSDSRLDATLTETLRISVGTKRHIFKQRLLILKGPDRDAAGVVREKGVLVLSFTPYFSQFRNIFTETILRDYHLVLEPSWVGLFLPEILQFRGLGHRIFVQGNEDRDTQFLQEMTDDLVPVPVAANGWVHPEVFKPLAGVEKKYDAIFLASWADYKRHYAFFRALRRLRNPRFRAACIGFPWPRKLDEIKRDAAYFGVLPQIDFFESIPPEKINELLNQAKAKFLFTRKEGCNRAIIEAMFADIPAFVLEGMNYGTRYPYLNSQTGGFFNEKELPDLLDAVHRDRKGPYEPRKWVLENMSPAVSTRLLEKSIFGDVRDRLRVKVNVPEFDYLDSKDLQELDSEYARLADYLRPRT